MYCMYYHPEEGNNNSLTLTLIIHKNWLQETTPNV